MRFHLAQILVSLISIASVVSAHPGDEHDNLTEEEKLVLRAATENRHLQARACGAAIESYTAQRKAKRDMLKKRGFSSDTLYTTGFSTATLTASGPSVTEFLNTTCITSPDVTEGPYYINNEFIRDDLREDQRGITLELDIGVFDTTTCKPLPGVFVELWNANATGQYTGFAASSAPGAPGGFPGGPGGPIPTGFPTFPPFPTGTGLPPFPTGFPPPGGPGGGGPPLTDGGSGLRGGYPTNKEGLVGIKTIYPGFYSGRTVHIHVMVHSNWEASDNGTIISKAGNVRHIGQFFFDEDWNDKVINTTEYKNNKQARTLNTQDDILRQANSQGFNAFVGLELVGETIEDGLLGYITIGVNTTELLPIASGNFNGGFKGTSEEL